MYCELRKSCASRKRFALLCLYSTNDLCLSMEHTGCHTSSVRADERLQEHQAYCACTVQLSHSCWVDVSINSIWHSPREILVSWAPRNPRQTLQIPPGLNLKRRCVAALGLLLQHYQSLAWITQRRHTNSMRQKCFVRQFRARSNPVSYPK